MADIKANYGIDFNSLLVIKKMEINIPVHLIVKRSLTVMWRQAEFIWRLDFIHGSTKIAVRHPNFCERRCVAQVVFVFLKWSNAKYDTFYVNTRMLVLEILRHLYTECMI